MKSEFGDKFTYPGLELELFSAAQNWKNYIRFLVQEYVKGKVLEIGAGIGSNTCSLYSKHHKQWLCLEPDTNLFQRLSRLIAFLDLKNCYCKNGTIDVLQKDQLFDSILYLDVLEHIHNDKKEITQASQHLNDKGILIILAPAHSFLFNQFDLAIGHYRRYCKDSLKHILPDSIDLKNLVYLDCVGLIASIANKFILKQSLPTSKQIQIWDQFMIPLSKYLDIILGYKLGKSILLIGQKNVKKSV